MFFFGFVQLENRFGSVLRVVFATPPPPAPLHDLRRFHKNRSTSCDFPLQRPSQRLTTFPKTWGNRGIGTNLISSQP